MHAYIHTYIHRVFCAVAFNYFYFAMLPYIDEPPAWCEDLGSLAFATNPRSGAVRDGDKAQHWKEDPDAPPIPTKSELETMGWFERISYHIADFYHTHLRSLRVLWNGIIMRMVVLIIMGRRTRVFGQRHMKHLGSHDKVLVAANHRTFFDFWVITVCGLWREAGVSLFSFYPVRATFFYTTFGGLMMNLGFSTFAMFPPIMNTPSDEQSKNEDGEVRKKQDAHKWNNYAIRRVISDLKTPGVLCGIHPEVCVCVYVCARVRVCVCACALCVCARALARAVVRAGVRAVRPARGAGASHRLTAPQPQARAPGGRYARLSTEREAEREAEREGKGGFGGREGLGEERVTPSLLPLSS